MTEPNPEETDEPEHKLSDAPRMWLNLAVTSTEKEHIEELVSLITEEAFLIALMAYTTVGPHLQPGDTERFRQALLQLAQAIESGTPGEAPLQALIANTYHAEENWEMMNMHARLGHWINGEPNEHSETVEIVAMSAHLRSPWSPEWQATLEYALTTWKRKERGGIPAPEDSDE